MQNNLIRKLLENGDAVVVNRNSPGIDMLLKVQRMMISPIELIYNDLAYLNTTQNMSYLKNVITEEMSSACVVLGGGDIIFQLLSMGITDITAVDRNELQMYMYTLKKAAVKTLSLNEFEDFMFDLLSPRFLSFDVFKIVADGFDDTEIAQRNFWENLLKLNSKEDLMIHFIKCGLESEDIVAVRRSLSYVKKKFQYKIVRDNLEKAQISIFHSDIIDFLEKSNKVYDYIDITNILIFVFQLEKSNIKEFKKKLLVLKDVFEKKLSEKGVFTLDYIFNTSQKEYMSNLFDLETDIGKILSEIQKSVMDVFKEVNSFEVEALSEQVYRNQNKKGIHDLVLYLKH